MKISPAMRQVLGPLAIGLFGGLESIVSRYQGWEGVVIGACAGLALAIGVRLLVVDAREQSRP